MHQKQTMLFLLKIQLSIGRPIKQPIKLPLKVVFQLVKITQTNPAENPVNSDILRVRKEKNLTLGSLRSMLYHFYKRANYQINFYH